jgi:hypothetical protein
MNLNEIGGNNTVKIRIDKSADGFTVTRNMLRVQGRVLEDNELYIVAAVPKSLYEQLKTKVTVLQQINE